MDTLANGLNAIKVLEQKGRNAAVIHPASKILAAIFNIFKEEGYFESVEVTNNSRGGQIKIGLLGKINDCGAVKPQHYVKTSDWEKFELRYLPGRGIGFLVVSTSQGIMTHLKAKEKGIGGKLVAFIY